MPELRSSAKRRQQFRLGLPDRLAEKGVPYKLTSVMPHTPEVDAIHPFGKIPAMRHGDVTLARIAGDLRLHRPRIRRAAPRSPPIRQGRAGRAVGVDRQHARSIRSGSANMWRAYIFPGTPDRARTARASTPRCRRWNSNFPVMDEAVKSGYLVGNSFTLADMNFMPILFYMTKFPESGELLARHHNLKAYFERHVARKSVQRHTPARARKAGAGRKTERRSPVARGRRRRRGRSHGGARRSGAPRDLRDARRRAALGRRHRGSACRSRARRCRSICACSATSGW